MVETIAGMTAGTTDVTTTLGGRSTEDTEGTEIWAQVGGGAIGPGLAHLVGTMQVLTRVLDARVERHLALRLQGQRATVDRPRMVNAVDSVDLEIPVCTQGSMLIESGIYLDDAVKAKTDGYAFEN